MPKRCCAMNCFNSVQYNKNISYFSFPKHNDFAQQWAHLAGRDDLMQKPLNSLVKYFLCSEHFTANCFLDKDKKQILKRNLPHSIAMPTIFKNNLQETIQNANPRHSIEVHNIVLIDVGKVQEAGSDDNAEYIGNNEAVDFFSEKFESSKQASKDDILQERDIAFHEEVKDEMLEKRNGNSFSPMLLDATSSNKCRLCARNLDIAEPRANFNDSYHLREFVDRVMHDQVCLTDNMSQVVCKNCENNALLCLLIIQEMDTAQQKMRWNTDI